MRPTKEKEQEAETHKLRRRRKLQKPQKFAILSISKGKLTENNSAPTNQKKNKENEGEREISA